MHVEALYRPVADNPFQRGRAEPGMTEKTAYG